MDETGLEDNTLIVFSADHGEMLGEKGLIQKRSLYDWSTRIPMIVAGPGVVRGTVDTPVSLLDLPATFLDIASVEPVVPMDGRSLLSAFQGSDIEIVPVISEYHGEGIMRPCFMVRKGPWKLNYIHGSRPQLFKLDEDPGEWSNLAGQRNYARAEKELTSLVTGGRFDLEFIQQDLWSRLAQKQVVNDAMEKNGTCWDYVVKDDAARKYVRK